MNWILNSMEEIVASSSLVSIFVKFSGIVGFYNFCIFPQKKNNAWIYQLTKEAALFKQGNLPLRDYNAKH